MFWTERKLKSYLLKDKLNLINDGFSLINAQSFADLGGVWRVEAGYTFYALDNYAIQRAILIDTHPTDYVINRSQKHSGLRIIRENFGNEQVVSQLEPVDAVFLFDVLLHQVNPNWDNILEMYAAKTRCFIIYNQQWIGSRNTVRLLELGEDAYFQNVPHRQDEDPYNDLFQKLDVINEDHQRLWRDVHNIWQWGITDKDLYDKMDSLGFRMQFMKNYGKFGDLPLFENHGFIFTKSS